MTFGREGIPINIVGNSYESRSRPINYQLTNNMYHQVVAGGKEPTALFSFPGQKLQSEVEGSTDRGMHEFGGTLYRVVDTDLYSVDKDFNHKLIWNTINGTGRCIFEDDGESLFVVADSIYRFNTTTGLMTIVNDSNIVGSTSVTFLNNQLIYTNTKTDLSVVSDVGDGSSASGLNAIGAESAPDKLVRDYAFNQVLYRFGEKTTEAWYNTGVGEPPIDRIEGQMFTVGLGAVNSVANTDNTLFWLGDDNCIYVTGGGQEQRISTPAVSNAIEAMTVIDDALGFTFTMQGQDFYLITFPTEGKTFVVNESLGREGWFNLSSGVGCGQGNYSGTSLIYFNKKNVVANGGKLSTLEYDTYTQDTDVMSRERITSPIDSKILGASGKELRLSSIDFDCEMGVGLISGQGEDPKILAEYSTDGGRSFKHMGWIRLGRMGETRIRAKLDKMLTFYNLMIKLTITDPVPVTIYGASAKLKLTGK